MKMARSVYDTRFFVEHYYSGDADVLRKTREELRKTRERFVSAVVVHEVYRLTLEWEGRETAVLRTSLLVKDFKVVVVDAEIARSSAELRHKHKVSLADSVIAATSLLLGAVCVSDDPHLRAMKEIRTRWI